MTTANKLPPTPPQRPEPPVPPEPPAGFDPNIYSLGELVAVIGRNPKRKKEILAMIREANPEVPIPELDLIREMDESVSQQTKELHEKNQTLETRLASLEGRLNRRSLQEEHGLSDEEFEDLAKLSKDKKIGDFEVALDHWSANRERLGTPRGAPAEPQFTAESRKELYRNPKQWALREGEKVLRDLRRRRGA